MADLLMTVDVALAEVPVNIMPLVSDADFKTIDDGIAFNESGMDLVWNFVTIAGAMTQTAVTPTSGGVYDWASQGNGMYSIEIPASGGASINNDTEGFGWFSGVCDGVLPWRGPVIQFSPAAVTGEVVSGLLDLADGVETGLTVKEALRLIAAACAGKLSGAATTTVTIRNAVADSKNRITATVDADGNRSAITYDLT